ncbi:MAG: DeoR/GlpR transcriptional regulator, partial [Spirochaetota bacterium]
IKAICYGLKIAEVLNSKRLIQFILLGGMYHKETDMFESFWDYDELDKIRAQKAFISAFGIHKQAGLTSGSFFASSIRRKILESSEKVYLLADSSKFGKIECAHFGGFKGIDTIITDEAISKDYMDFFSDLGIPVIRV